MTYRLSQKAYDAGALDCVFRNLARYSPYWQEVYRDNQILTVPLGTRYRFKEIFRQGVKQTAGRHLGERLFFFGVSWSSGRYPTFNANEGVDT